MPRKKHYIKTASPQQVWLFLQRLLAFDIPTNRWPRIISSLNKYLGHTNNAHLLNSTFFQQGQYLAQIYGPGLSKHSKACQLFNFALAAEELQRFDGTAFDNWYDLFPTDKIDFKDLKRLKSLFENSLGQALSNSQAAWLAQAFYFFPNWQILNQPGIWNKKPIAKFFQQFDQQINTQKQELSARRLKDSSKLFKSLLEKMRDQLPTNFLPQVVMLVEGPSEAVLLPPLSKLIGKSFSDQGVFVLACGGSKQLERKYMSFQDTICLPVVIVLDRDAYQEYNNISKILRLSDRLCVWNKGELEDTFLIVDLMHYANSYLKSLGNSDPILLCDLLKKERLTIVLDRLWNARGLGNFDKPGFAEFLSKNIKSKNLPVEIKDLITMVSSLPLYTT